MAMKTYLTTNRQVILDTIVALPGHPTAAEVYDAARRCRPRIAVGTVYTALHFLVDRHLIAEVRRPDGVVSYDREVSPHDHLICRRCGRLEDVPRHLQPSYAVLEQQTGFRLEGHRVEFVGLCPACQAA